LLKELVTDISDSQQLEEPLTQILVTTHSPTSIAQPDLIDSILFVYMVTRISPLSTGVPPIRITQAVPVLLSSEVRENGLDKAIDKQDASYTIDQVTTLLTNTQLDKALDRLNASRTLLGER